MTKITWREWLVIIPIILLFILVLILYVITDFNINIRNALFIIFGMAVLILTFVFSYQIFDWGEKMLRYDARLIELEKEDAGLFWAYIGAFGLAFLIPGITEKAISMIVTGLIFLALANVFYYAYYMPRQRFLIRQRIAQLDIEKAKR